MTIRGRLWKVKRWADLNAAERKAIGGGSKIRKRNRWQGFSHDDLREIHLGWHRSARAECSTFLHELLHSCCDSGPPAIHDRCEEQLIANIEDPLLRALGRLVWR